MIAVSEPDSGSLLLEFDTIEYAASNVARTFEGIAARAGDQDRLLSRLELTAKALISGVPQKTSANRGNAGECHVEIDECVVGVPGLWVLSGLAFARLFECLIDFPDGELQTADRPVSQKAIPIPDLEICHIDSARARHLDRPRSGRSFRRDPSAAHEADRRPDDAVGHNENGYRGSADDVGLWGALLAGGNRADFRPDQIVESLDHTLFRYAHEDDRLFVVDELETSDHACGVYADEHVHRLSGIAHGAGKVGIQVDVAEEAVICVDRQDRRVALWSPEPRCLGKKVLRVGARCKFGQPRLSTGGLNTQYYGERGQRRAQGQGQGHAPPLQVQCWVAITVSSFPS